MGNERKSSNKRASRAAEKRAITIICAVLAAIIIALGGYAAGWYLNRARILGSTERYREMYAPEPIIVALPTETATPTPVPTPTPEPSATATPPEPRVFSLPTAPPVLPAFEGLIRHNADTVGYLDIEDVVTLPVVQRENDNAHYLDHNFDGEEAKEGALFLDGMNRLTPEDDCLIVYGHNMKNGTMFGNLSAYETLKFLKAHPIARFDTIYENRLYVPFAAFTASMDPNEAHYFDVRQFIFDEQGFELFTLKLQARSEYSVPVDVRYGDRLLLLVTCDYTNKQGRFILALRALRDGESRAEMMEMVKQAK